MRTEDEECEQATEGFVAVMTGAASIAMSATQATP